VLWRVVMLWISVCHWRLGGLEESVKWGAAWLVFIVPYWRGHQMGGTCSSSGRNGKEAQSLVWLEGTLILLCHFVSTAHLVLLLLLLFGQMQLGALAMEWQFCVSDMARVVELHVTQRGMAVAAPGVLLVYCSVLLVYVAAITGIYELHGTSPVWNRTALYNNVCVCVCVCVSTTSITAVQRHER
jgi:hypothetical protein